MLPPFAIRSSLGLKRFNKPALRDLAIGALEDAGWAVRELGVPQTHPVVFVMERAGTSHTVEMYIWNLSEGGRAVADEYRIQITHAEYGFELKAGVKTLLLGWREDLGVFAAFDVARRRGQRPQRHSVQIARSTLDQAATFGGAIQNKGTGEWAAAVRPDYLHRYIEGIDRVHAGDAGALFRDGVHADALGELAATQDASRRWKFGSEEERREREAVLERLSALERQVLDLTVRRGRGHNNPPELIVDDPLEPLAPVIQATRDIREELEARVPDVPAVARRAAFLARLRDRLRRGANVAERVGRRVATKAEEKTVELVVGLVFAASAWKPFLDAIEGLLGQLARWIQAL